MQSRLLTLAFIMLAVLTCLQSAFAQSDKRRMVFLSISADTKARVGSQQEWIEMLQGVGADRVSSKTARLGIAGVKETETTRGTVVSVTGFIEGTKLKLPGGTFSLRDKAGIRNLIQKIRDDGARVALAEKKAFGLTSEQLVYLHQKFAQRVDFSTKGQNAGEVIGKLVAKSGINLVLDPAARAAASGDEVVSEELNGMSIGMALATIARPLGLVVEPKREQGKPIEVHLLDSTRSTENWPIGWPIEQPPVSVEPKLFVQIPIQIQNFPLEDVLKALEKRAKVPFFFDHNSMAREGIELADVKVTVASKKIAILTAVSRALKQTKPKMFYEIRLDETGKPFLWLSVR
ncbi:MAG: hypothetical protein ACI87E_000272 [Mariniblastus sp.]|jgi:hypothetical protein